MIQGRRNNLLRIGLVTLLSVCAVTSSAVSPVEVVGLFKNRAVVRVVGEEKLLRVGETSPAGVTLLQADANGATVRYKGQQYTLTLSNRVSGSFQEAPKPAVAISADQLGQYRIRGTINNQYVDFLVDTGASVIALSSRTADSLGLNYLSGQKGTVATAQGMVESYFVTLDQVTISGIVAHNVEAAVISGRFPLETLLGMSFLRGVGLEEKGGVMTLTQRF